MLAIIDAKKDHLLSPSNWLKNISAGIIVGVVALPLAMAFAIASGAKPEQGLYTAIVAAAVVSLFGGSRVQIAGPTGAFIVVLSSITAQYGIEGLQIATLMAGIMLIVLGLAKLGGVIRFIPAPVIIGFTSGIAVIIWVGQWQHFFGLPASSAEHFHQKFAELISNFTYAHSSTTAIGLVSLSLLLVWPKLPGLKRVPAPLIAMLVATGAQVAFGFEGVQTIGSAFGQIPSGLPPLSIPPLSMGSVIVLIGPAFTIAMLGSIESLLSAVVADKMSGTRHDSNQELIGQGLANVIAPLFGGFAATGAIARTATNIKNGGNSPIAGLVHSATLIAILYFLAPCAAHIPLSCLAAILFVVAWNMSEIHQFKRMLKRAPTADVVILVTTFVLTVFADLVIAVNIGVILATLQFLRRMSTSVEVRLQSQQELSRELGEDYFDGLSGKVAVYAIYGPLFFGATENLVKVIKEQPSLPEHLIIRFTWVPFTDITGIQMLEGLIEELHAQGITVCITETTLRVKQKLAKAGIFAMIGPQHTSDTLAQGLKQLA